MRGVLIASCAALALLATSASADQRGHDRGHSGYGKDRGSHYGGKHDGKGYGRHDRDRRGGRHGGKPGRGYGHKGGYGHDYCESPEPDPEPEPNPDPTPSPTPERTAAPSLPGPEQDTDSNSRWLDQFGGHLSGDPVTSKMVSDYVHGARRLEHIIVDRSGPVIVLRPAPEAEALSWWQAPVANW